MSLTGAGQAEFAMAVSVTIAVPVAPEVVCMTGVNEFSVPVWIVAGPETPQV